jgi:hypothetical protein
MFHDRAAVADIDVGERVGPALIPDQHRIALGIIPGVRGPLHDFYLSAVRVLTLSSGNPL